MNKEQILQFWFDLLVIEHHNPELAKKLKDKFINECLPILDKTDIHRV